MRNWLQPCLAHARTKPVGAVIALLILVTLWPGEALAQTDIAQRDQEAEIIVTGSRLAQRDHDSAPKRVLDADDIQRAGATSVGDLLATLPYMQGSGLSPASNANGRGVSNVNLRGIGAARTLVLVNGRRTVATNNLSSALTVDLNTIAPLMIERVELVTGGASSVYGSDAVAGVLNFILLKRYDGFKLTAQSGVTARGDGGTVDLGLLWGAHSDRGSVVVGLSYLDRRDVYAGNRELFRNYLVETGNPPQIVAGGSGTSGNPRADTLIIPAQGAAARPFTIADAYNTAPLAYLQTPQKRLTANLVAEYDLGGVDVFSELTYSHRQSVAFLGAFPVVIGPNELGGQLRQLIRSNSFNTFPNAATLGFFQRRFVEAGPRYFSQNAETVRAVAGVRGHAQLLGPWTWEISYVFGRNRVEEVISGRPNFARLAQALDPSQCSSAASPPPGVAPCINLFYPGSIRPIDAEWVTYTDYSNFSVRQHVLTAFLSGTVAHLPHGPIDLVIGGEYRRDSVEDNPDPITVAGLTAGSQRDPTRGGYSVAELFGEVRVPILADMPGFRTLSVEGSARYSSISRGNDRNRISYRAAATWTPLTGVQLEAGFSEAFRSPNVNELFLGKGRNFPSVADPCGNLTAASNADILRNCQAQGVPLNMVPAFSFQTPAAVGGNQQLTPERARTWSVRATLDPAFAPALHLSAEWFKIDVRDPIGITSVATVYDECYRLSNPHFCGLVARDPLNGQLLEVVTPFVNQARLRTSGLDVEVRARFEMAPQARLEMAAAATYLARFDQQARAGTAARSSVGYIETAGGAFPRWRGTFRTTLESSAASRPVWISWSMRYVGELKSWRLRDAPTALNAAPTIAPYLYHNLAMGLRIDRVEFTLGVNNLFDRQAPYYTGAPDTNTDVETFDVIGRSLFLRVSTTF